MWASVKVGAVVITLMLGGVGFVIGTPVKADGAQPKTSTHAKGTFRVAYGPVRNQDYIEWQTELKKAKILESLADDLNNEIALPVDVLIGFAECGTINAFYDPNKKAIHICYELVEHLEETFAPDADSEEELDEAVADATSFVFFHELGHALAHVLQLPLTGKEEDAVDQLATMILVEGDDEEEGAALNGAKWFLLEAQGKEWDLLSTLPFWEEHSLDQQRFYNILCWVYGSNEKTYASLVEDGILPEERAARCHAEYAKLAKSWDTLLAPHLKKK